jgi:hypothetical protein
MGLLSGIGSLLGSASSALGLTKGGLVGGLASGAMSLLDRSDAISSASAANAAGLQGLALQARYNRQAASTAFKRYKSLSDTAIQRQVKDMRKAGINPILAGKYGGASSAPIQASGVGIPPVFQANLGQHMSTAFSNQTNRINAQTQRMQTGSNIQLQGAQIRKTEAEVQSTMQGIVKSKQEVKQIAMAIEKTKAEIGMIGQNINQSKAYIRKLAADTKLSRAIATIPEILEKNLREAGFDKTTVKEKAITIFNHYFGSEFDTATGSNSHIIPYGRPRMFEGIRRSP